MKKLDINSLKALVWRMAKSIGLNTNRVEVFMNGEKLSMR